MQRIVYVNGAYVADDEAMISVFDRGFLFGDGVYEVCAVLNRQLIDASGHLGRLHRSLKALEIDPPCSDPEILGVQQQLIEKNAVSEGAVYLQVTRGGRGDRDFKLQQDMPSSLIAFTQQKPLIEHPQLADGLCVITLPDLRWKRRDIKSIGLLPAVIAKQQALRAGADEAWWVEDDSITEGSSSNAFIIKDQRLITRPLGTEILPGITRSTVLKAARHIGLAIDERPFTVAEACQADEAFITSTTTFVMPVVRIDNQPIGDGTPGPLARQLRTAYIERIGVA